MKTSLSGKTSIECLPRIARVAALLILLPVCQTDRAFADGDVAPNAKTRTGSLTVYDTGGQSVDPLAPSHLVAKSGWRKVSASDSSAAIKGDVVVSNGRILAVARRQGSGIELYSEDRGGPVARLQLRILTPGGESATQLEQMNLLENSKSAACLQVSGKTAKGSAATAKFRIKRGEVVVETEPGPNAGRLRIECPCRFTVLPDFFADDILIDAAKIPTAYIEVPTDNFVVHLTGAGDGIGICAFENRRQDVKLTLAGEAAKRAITGSEIDFEGKKIWVALLASPQVWYHREIQPDDAGQILPLQWHMPFPAQWRVDFTQAGSLTDSWEMLLQDKKNAKFSKPSWMGGRQETVDLNRRRWNTFLGTFPYPCWSDHEHQGYLQPLEKEAFQFKGPVVLYPINRVANTPLDVFTVVDIMRNTLGAGPCEHILDVEGQKTDYQGRPTCGVQWFLERIFGANEQKQKRAEVEEHLEEGLAFVTHIRNRISRYIEFGRKMREYLAAQKKSHPELSAALTELDKIVERIDSHVAPETAKIQPPSFVAKLNDDFRKNVLNAGRSDDVDRCKQYCKVLTDIGGNQDELVGECRWVVRVLRQRTGMLVATDPRLAPIAGEIRTRTQEVLRSPAGYEWSRH